MTSDGTLTPYLLSLSHVTRHQSLLYELGNAGSNRPTGRGGDWNSVVDLFALQIRAQTKERRQSAVHALTDQWGDVTESLHGDPEMAAIFVRGAQSFKDLDTISKVRFSAFFNRLLNVFEGMYFSHAQGLLTESSWRAIERTMIDLVNSPGVQQWWETRKRWHTEEFDQLVREIIAKGNKSSAFSHYDLSKITKSDK